ncbi:helix-turn-helix domain-containing protein [Sediminicurvatus halobius]|uniref:DNA-binding protein n=1 Tax=Sediminicurvatus halobius TaxID=2182432 RepID=A0A2U2N0F3_9GAMM|nr:helix-turn-helix domain-containing protein [Spiribacter halobius]PWG62523.1 DNA-binding protein [Spiribacter halobius]UEX78619.1 helix-turn-helix domain-containing protein [Spiribacter halobius]
MPDSTPVLTTAEAARYLQVSERSLIRWRVQRRGPAWTYAGRQVRYRIEDLDAYLSGRTRRPVAEEAA